LLEKRQGDNEVNEIKDEVKIEVDMKRRQMMRKVANLRKRAKRRKAALENQLSRIRMKIAHDIMEANKDGNMELCRKGNKSALARNGYCDNNFMTNYIKNYDCKQKESFCYMCCENEFGNNFLDRREECYDMCDGKKVKVQFPIAIKKQMAAKKSKKKKQLKKLGGWIWTKLPAKKGKRRN